MPELNAHQTAELKNCFDLFDTDKSGSISSSELNKVVEALGIQASPAELKDLLKLMDKDGSGSIDFTEFVNIMADQFYTQPTTKDLEDAFHAFDGDNNGYISVDELFIVMSRFRHVDKKSIQMMVKTVDKNNDGKLSIKEFIAIMSKI